MLVVGAYGTIGLAVAKRLTAAGHEVIAVGRSRTAMRLLPNVRWIRADLARRTARDWETDLDGVDAIINAAGALQSGLRDDLDSVHHGAVASLLSACESRGVPRFVQISAVGADTAASTEFMRSKARGDDRVRSSSLSWVIIRPGLVVGPSAYGGAALIRAAAGMPLVLPIAFGNSRIQTVAMADLVDVVLDAVCGRLPEQAEFDLVEPHSHALSSVIRQFRDWLGVGPVRAQLNVPRWLLFAVGSVADGLGHLGWRSPLRTTTLRVLSEGVRGDPGPFARMDSRRRPSSLAQTLAAMPSTQQERWFARLYLTMPLIIAVLASFWVLSGAIALLSLDTAAAMLGRSGDAWRWGVALGGLADIGLGAALVYRPWSRAAAVGMCLLTTLYLVVGSAIHPQLWADPLGPLLKAVPVLMLSFVAAMVLQDR